MAETNGTSTSTLPPEAIAFATRMYDAARNGQLDIFQQALPAGLPANMTNDKGDSLVCSSIPLPVLLLLFLLLRFVSACLSLGDDDWDDEDDYYYFPLGCLE
jgi:hypothetical protein